MAQDNTPAIVMYKGPQEDGYSIPFDKGYYGEVTVAFVRRGLTDYEYNPATYDIDGELYAWEVSSGVYYYTKSAAPAVNATVYDSGNQEISGVKVVSTQNASASFSDGKTGIRSNKKDIHSHALLFWTGEPLGDDDWICIVRETVKKQPYSYPNNQKHIEGALDNLSRQIQELKAQSDVSLKVDPTFVQDPQKMNPIDWLNTIVRSTDTTSRGLRYRNFWLEYSTDDPNKVESDKSWTKLLNTTNITSVREWYDEDNNVYIPQYSMDGGLTWKALGAIHLIEEVQEQIDELKENVYTKTQVDGKFSATNAAVDANADAIQKTREDFASADQDIRDDMNAEDSRLQSQITAHATAITTNRNDIDDLGDDVAEIQAKIPESASGSNQLATSSDLNNYVKKSGDSMSGQLSISTSNNRDQIVLHGVMGVDGVVTPTELRLGDGTVFHGDFYVGGNPNGSFSITNSSFVLSPYPAYHNVVRKLGKPNSKFAITYTETLNNGAELKVPTSGGTLARLEDLTAGSLNLEVVDTLPETGKVGTIYLVRKAGSASDRSDEYVWIEDESRFEFIGTTQVDLTGYATTDYVDTIEQEIRDDINAEDSRLQSQITVHADAITALQNEQTATGNQIQTIESKIPDGTSDTNPLINKQQLLDEEMDIREDLNSGLSELQTQITAQAAEIATKQDELIAGANITIVGNVISATGGGGGGGGTAEYPDQTGNAGKFLVTDGANVSWSNKLTGPLVIYGEKDSSATSSTDVLTLERLNTSTGTISEVTITYSSSALNFGGLGITGVNSLRPSSSSTSSLGSATYKWAYVYAQQIGGLKVPDGVGTIAKAEDLADLNNNSVVTKDLTVGTDEGTLNIGVVAGTATIATNNGLDIVAQTKFDTAPTTDDNTTYADALEVSLMRKAQVATAISDALANVDALPSQSGNEGKVLSTNGSEAEWTEMPGLIIRRL